MQQTQTAKSIHGGVATIFVSDMDRAVAFYTETLPFQLQHRADDHWASIDAGNGFMLGLHPQSEKTPSGRSGSISIGFNVSGSLDKIVADLRAKGVTFNGPITDDGPVRLAFFGDPDGNDLYLCEYQPE